MTTESKTRTNARAKVRSRKSALTPEERYLTIQVEAYSLADKDGFGKPAVEYWLAAEAKLGS